MLERKETGQDKEGGHDLKLLNHPPYHKVPGSLKFDKTFSSLPRSVA